MIALPEFTFIGQASSAGEIAAKLERAARSDEWLEAAAARQAMSCDLETVKWYTATVRETQHEITHVNGEALIP